MAHIKTRNSVHYSSPCFWIHVCEAFKSKRVLCFKLLHLFKVLINIWKTIMSIKALVSNILSTNWPKSIYSPHDEEFYNWRLPLPLLSLWKQELRKLNFPGNQNWIHTEALKGLHKKLIIVNFLWYCYLFGLIFNWFLRTKMRAWPALASWWVMKLQLQQIQASMLLLKRIYWRSPAKRNC